MIRLDRTRVLRYVWTCADFTHHEHRWKWSAWLCGLLQRAKGGSRY